LFTQHLRIQLPLLALQSKIRGKAGIDARGYRYVVAVLDPDSNHRMVEDQTIVMRPLAFVPQRRTDGSHDEVANMFVIGPEDPSAGPCLLYRPMLDQPLTQYPSPSNLLYAIQQSASLRDSVLAWLPDRVRSDYANYVFPGTLPSPWAVTEFLVDAEKMR
ncbi:dermonecrotic toxin domain-containing protein, partial [Mesorhizobium japonicum]